MDLRALRYFIEVVRQNGFTRAAETLHVTQPTISKMVKALEDEFGGPLLLREGRSVQLTDAGQVVYDRGLQVLSQTQLLRQEVADGWGLARSVPVIAGFRLNLQCRRIRLASSCCCSCFNFYINSNRFALLQAGQFRCIKFCILQNAV